MTTNKTSMLYRSIVGILVAANLIAGAGLLARWARTDDTSTAVTITEADEADAAEQAAEEAELAEDEERAAEEEARIAEEQARAEDEAAEEARLAEEAEEEARLADEAAAEEERLANEAAEEEARLADEAAEEESAADEAAEEEAAADEAAEEEARLAEEAAEEAAAAAAEEARLAEEAAGADGDDEPNDDTEPPTTSDVTPGAIDAETVLSSVELIPAADGSEAEQTIDTSTLWSGDDLPIESGFRDTFLDQDTPIVEVGTQYSLDWQVFSLRTGQLIESTYELYPDGELPVYTIGNGEQPAVLEDALTGNPIESDYLVVYPLGMSDLPTNLAADDAYVLYVQVYQYFDE